MKAALQFSDQASSGQPLCSRQSRVEKLLSNNLHLDLPKWMSQPQQFVFWQDELNFWQLEVSFYHHLLTLGILNCKPDSRHRLDHLRHAFSVYEHELLPGIKAFMEEILSEAPGRCGLRVSILQNTLKEHAVRLKKLKAEVFPFLSEILFIQIW